MNLPFSFCVWAKMKDKALWVAFRNSLQVSIVEQYSALEGETLKVIYGKLIPTH